MPAKAYDVWFVAANTVYKAVPVAALTDWAQQGRIGPADKIRPAGGGEWAKITDVRDVADFLFAPLPVIAAGEGGAEAGLEQVELDLGWHGPKMDEDDEVDMIPLIDISLVLLIFFMMTASVSALSPVQVPGLTNGADLKSGGDGTYTVHIDKNGKDELFYAVRAADKPPEKEDTNLISLGDALLRLDRMLGALPANGPRPEVRIACHEALPAERVHELAKELQKRKDQKRIEGYSAEVNEKKGK